VVIDSSVKQLFNIPKSLIDNFSSICDTVDWSAQELIRNDPLGSRTIRIPFGYRKDPEYELTEQIQRVQNHFFEEMNPWLKKKFSNRIFFKGEINYIFPSTVLLFHVDSAWFHEFSSRIHIPILTNDQTFWATSTELIHLPVGYVYEVNNRELHSYWNKGGTGRLHIVIDVMDQDIYNGAVSRKIDFNQLTTDTMPTSPEKIFNQNKWQL